MTTTPTLHYESGEPPELQFPCVDGSHGSTVAAVSAQPDCVLLMAGNDAVHLGADKARRVAEQIMQAAGCVDSETPGADPVRRAIRLLDMGFPLIAREVLRQSVESVER